MFISSLSALNQSFRMMYDTAKFMLESGKKVDIEVKEHKHKRTLEQNNYYWLFCGQLADFFDESGLTYGEYKLPYTGELIHDINKKLFGVKTTTKMSISEFCQYMNKLIIFWGEKTDHNFQMSELPANYLERKGYLTGR